MAQVHLSGSFCLLIWVLSFALKIFTPSDLSTGVDSWNFASTGPELKPSNGKNSQRSHF